MKKKELNLGIIGFSEGNGHPYSWSAIFNGYDPKKISSCGYPVIEEYLSKRIFPRDSIKEAKVSHVWSQNIEESKKIAKTCFIDNIIFDIREMIGKVDGVLLARDDAQNHHEIAIPFLENGLPIFIDKPFTLSVKEAEKILSKRMFSHQIFTCSALRYAQEFQPSKEKLKEIGKIKSIEGKISKDWDRYSIHIIEPILNLIPHRGNLLSYKRFKEGGTIKVDLCFENIQLVTISTIGDNLIKPNITVVGENASLNLVFNDTFSAFKKTLQTFTNSIIKKKNVLDESTLLEIIKVLEIGRGL